MNPILGYASMLNSSAQGVSRAFDGAARAGAEIARLSIVASSGDRLTLSPESVAQSNSAEGAMVGGLEGQMIDLRVSKYVAIANLRVLATADQLAEETMNIVDPKR